LKSKQNSVFATRLQTSQSEHETIDLFRCVKKHHEKQVISFRYLQAFGIDKDTLVNGEVQKSKWSNNCHKNQTESHQTYFWKVVDSLGKSINLKLTGYADFAKFEFKTHLVSTTTPW